MQNNKKIKTSLFSTPAISVPNNFTALHLAHISWNLYSVNAPTHYTNEFSIHDGGDFAMYNISDAKDISEHYFDCAFAIAESVKQDVNYSVQDAYNTLEEIYADTCVRESVASETANAVQQFVDSKDYNKHTDYILQDYEFLLEDINTQLPKQIAQLRQQLAKLEATQHSIQ